MRSERSSASRRGPRRLTPTRCGRSSVYRDGGISLPRSGRSRAWILSPSPTSPRRLVRRRGLTATRAWPSPGAGAPFGVTRGTTGVGLARPGRGPVRGNGRDDHTGGFARARAHHRAPQTHCSPRGEARESPSSRRRPATARRRSRASGESGRTARWCGTGRTARPETSRCSRCSSTSSSRRSHRNSPRDRGKVAAIAAANPSPSPLGRALDSQLWSDHPGHRRHRRRVGGGRDSGVGRAPLDARRRDPGAVGDHDARAAGLVHAAPERCTARASRSESTSCG